MKTGAVATPDNKEKSRHITPRDIERVIETAGRLFAESGYDGVGMRKIAAESGVNLSSIQYHFGTKASLFEEILSYKYEAFYETVTRAIDPAHGPEQKLESAIGAMFDSLLSDQVFLMLLQRDIVDMAARKQRPAFVEGYSKYFSLSCTLLQAVLDRPIEKHIVFSLISVILGYTELVAALDDGTLQNRINDKWYTEQRARLIAVGRRICLV